MIRLSYEQLLGICVASAITAAILIVGTALLIMMMERRRQAAKATQRPLTLLKGRPVVDAVDAVDVANAAHVELSEGRHRWGRR